MSITIVWDNDACTTLRYIYEGAWAWQDLFSALEEGNHWMDEVDHPVDIIIDMRATSYIPPNAILNMRKAYVMGRSHPRYSGATVFLRAGTFIRAVHDLVRDVYPEVVRRIAFLYADTLEEARALLEERHLQPG